MNLGTKLGFLVLILAVGGCAFGRDTYTEHTFTRRVRIMDHQNTASSIPLCKAAIRLVRKEIDVVLAADYWHLSTTPSELVEVGYESAAILWRLQESYTSSSITRLNEITEVLSNLTTDPNDMPKVETLLEEAYAIFDKDATMAEIRAASADS